MKCSVYIIERWRIPAISFLHRFIAGCQGMSESFSATKEYELHAIV